MLFLNIYSIFWIHFFAFDDYADKFYPWENFYVRKGFSGCDHADCRSILKRHFILRLNKKTVLGTRLFKHL